MNSPLYLDYVEDARSLEEPAPAASKRGWRMLGWVSVFMSVLLVGGSLSAYAAYRKIEGNIDKEDVSALIGKQPPKLNNAMNILLLGSDTRAGDNAKYGRRMKNEAARADTTILVHLSPGGGAATGISFPRDLMVDIPSCKNPATGTMTAPHRAQINEAYTIGGAACTWRTIEAISGIHIDHFALVDFTGFKSVVNALGGIDICLEKDVNDPLSKLNLKKGRHVVKGETALAYVRARHGLGDGSDLSRIKRQQKFLGSVANKAMSKGVLTNPKTLLSFLNATTKSLKVDSKFTVNDMRKLGESLKGMGAGKVRFVTVPWTAYAPDPNRVALRQPDADKFFVQVAHDTEIQDMAKVKAVKVPPAQVKIRIYNGSGVTGLASRVREQLVAQGYQVLAIGNPKTNPPATQILYGSGAENAAQTLAALVPGGKPAPRTSGGTGGVVDLVLGPDWTALKPAKAGLPSKIEGETKATDNLCKAT